MSILKTFGIRFSLVICILAVNGMAMGQTQQPKTAPKTEPASPTKQASPQPTWMVNCTNVAGGFDCRASQTLFNTKTGVRVLTLVVRKTPSEKKPVMLIQAPLGIYLPAGITIQIGDSAKTVAFQSCNRDGCLTEYAISDAEIAAMQKGSDVTITVQTLQKSPVKLTIPARGFPEAYAKIK